MGSDLVGYLVEGPLKISNARIQRAAKHLYKLANSPSPRCPRFGKKLAETEEANCPECDGRMPDLSVCRTKKGALLTARYVAAGWPPDSRDCSVRLSPSNPRRLLVFAGDQTWGDEPEGRGYVWFRNMFDLGIDRAFGIR